MRLSVEPATNRFDRISRSGGTDVRDRNGRFLGQSLDADAVDDEVAVLGVTEYLAEGGGKTAMQIGNRCGGQFDGVLAARLPDEDHYRDGRRSIALGGECCSSFGF